MNIGQRVIAATLSIGLALATASTAAAETAREFAERTSAELVAVVTEAQDYFDEEPEKLDAEMSELLNEIVDFNSIAKGVMGKKHFTAASEEQRNAFAAVFKTGLVKTYGKALIGFGEMDIEVVDVKGSSPKKQTVDLIAKSGLDGTQVSVRYSIAGQDDGQWRVRNMTIEGVNLGKTYRSQFGSGMTQNAGDMDAVIANWSVAED